MHESRPGVDGKAMRGKGFIMLYAYFDSMYIICFFICFILCFLFG